MLMGIVMLNSMQIFLPRPDIGIEDQKTDVLFAMAIWGEARGEYIAGKTGVAYVIKNRAEHPRWWGHDLREVVLKPFQFSCLNINDPNRSKLLLPLKHDAVEVWDECYEVAFGVMNDDMPNPVGLSDHYFDDSIAPPRWAKADKFVNKIGRLNFYRLEL